MVVAELVTFVAQLLSKYPIDLVVMDGDFVEESNLERQVLFDYSDVGKLKVNVAKAKLGVEVIPEFLDENNIPEADLLIDCTDNFETRKIINDNAKVIGFTQVLSEILEWSTL